MILIGVTAIKTTLWSIEWGIAELVNHLEIQQKLRNELDTVLAESKILVNAWWLANNPANWKNPQDFRPERFLEEEAKVEANGNDFRYLPFGVVGSCRPGIILALPILGITLGRLGQNFELLPPPGHSKLDTSMREANSACTY
ncbi:hypothetical protein SO802_017323 [Lithocarpus litseifolius]|uniref:Trans-cinnamate 4-monooxygenase n=1 Tax=Lithocarpus litseifolius TaxID=425828 RepID=A0AAW2D133_9ROSI